MRDEVVNAKMSSEKLFQIPRIFDNLLSSQPLCFNLFAELQQDIDLATAVMRELVPGRIERVTGIAFEYSPGRGDPRYTNDKSAFDAYVAFETPGGGQGFAGIETKYSETLAGSAAPHRRRYDEVATLMGCFKQKRLRDLRDQPLHQIWRDHLLAGSLRAEDDYEDGFFVFLYPEGNRRCRNAQLAYQDSLLDNDTFLAWTLEKVTTVIKRHTRSAWIDDFVERYLNFDKLQDTWPWPPSVYPKVSSGLRQNIKRQPRNSSNMIKASMALRVLKMGTSKNGEGETAAKESEA
ncbi:MAG: hypothetical protein U9Q70_09610 [Chloroflexota bacterium]|nr:hypothetical protein [Chloroflexota bacterium]